MSNYTNQNNVEKYLNVTLPASLSAYVTAYLNVADAYIENYTGRKFKDVANATKYYDCIGGVEIYIDDFEGTPTVITLDADGDDEQTLVLNDDFYTYPLNETVKNKLVLVDGNNRIGAWPDGSKRLKVTANFGRTTAPADIVLVATRLVADILQQYLKGGKTKSEAVGDVSFTYADVDEAANALGVFNILNQYRNIPIGL
ncbi:MAG TPA: hypothetical protein VJL60_03000 [Gammaproteobacteria bacterium]|nr:hypothetical protein [Gammaproteobacteria bacterium]